MSANVETMFYTRVSPWHGLGVRVESALSSEEALEKSSLDIDPNNFLQSKKAEVTICHFL
jgi:hypothetical protein